MPDPEKGIYQGRRCLWLEVDTIFAESRRKIAQRKGWCHLPRKFAAMLLGCRNNANRCLARCIEQLRKGGIGVLRYRRLPQARTMDD